MPAAVIEKISPLPFSKQTEKINREKYTRALSGEKKVLVNAEWPAARGVSQEDMYRDQETEFYHMIASYNQMAEAAQAGFDNIPAASSCGGIAYMMALAYGCEMHIGNGLVTALVKYNSIEDAKNFTAISDIENFGLYPLVLKRIGDFQKRYPQVPLGIPDNQSPVNVLTSVMKSDEAMVAMFTDQELIRGFLAALTDSIIRINIILKERITNFAGFKNNKWLPFGIHCADDNAAFLSPEIYREFAMPYVQKLSDTFGGIDLHCCLQYDQNLANMTGMGGFLEFDPQVFLNPLDTIISSLKKNNRGGVWHVFNYPWGIEKNRQIPDLDMYKMIIDRTEGLCALKCTCFSEKKDEALRLAEKVKSYAIGKNRNFQESSCPEGHPKP